MKSIMSRLAPVLAVSFWALPVFAQGLGGREYYGHNDWGAGAMVFGGLMMVAFWGGIIYLIVVVVRGLGGSGATRHDPPAASRSALDTLRDRYARGEIDHDEFERRKQLLTD